MNQLIREDNEVLNKTITYSYDAGGNILSKTEYPHTIGTLGDPTSTISYDYEDTNWKDKLTSYNEKDITYDAIGNPLTYDGYTFTWEQGRQLATMKSNDYDISFKYNVDGIRTEKTVNGITTKYHLVGDKVTFEDNGTDKIYYTYDAGANLVSMNLNGIEYYYIRNAQGDIIGLYDKNGIQVVSYIYDSWGKLISIDGSLKDTVGVKNPYRYRGYRYDSETGLYYLQSRYYNPEWGRFINTDAIAGQVGELFGHNLFIYCKNNSVNAKDPSGFKMMFSDEETQRQYDQWTRVQSGAITEERIATHAKKPLKNNLINVGRSVCSNILNGGVDSVAATAAAKYVKTGPKYIELSSLTLGKFVEKNPLGAFLKTTAGKIGVTSIIGIFTSAVTNFRQYDFKGAIGRTAIDALFVGGAVGLTVMVPGIGFAAAVGIGVMAEAASRVTKKAIYGDAFWN